MSVYTNEQIEWLRGRWRGYDKELNALISEFKTNEKWHESKLYKTLMDAMQPFPEGLEAVQKDLRGVILAEKDLSGYLEGIDFSWGYLVEANLSGADLKGAKLSGVNLERADLSDANLSEADLSEADLGGADLMKAYLGNADLSECNLYHTKLHAADLWRANLSKAYLESTDLSQANLKVANLTGATLMMVDLSETNLLGADLSGANLLEGNLSGVYLADVKYTTDEIFSWLFKYKIPHILHHIPIVNRFKWKPLGATDFIGVDTTRIDGSKNPIFKRHIEDYQFIQAFKNKGWFHRWVAYPLWKWTCDCGRSLLLWAFWSVVFALFFGWIYSIHLDWFRQPNLSWFDVLYFSVVTFTTLGFGDVTPHHGNITAQAWIMAEVIIGYIMLGGLISIFANKLARRA